MSDEEMLIDLDRGLGYGQAQMHRLGSHFGKNDMQYLLREHCVSHYTGPISHPSSNGLLERNVHEILALPSKKCIERGTTNSYSLSVRDYVLIMNRKITRIHPYTPSAIMLRMKV